MKISDLMKELSLEAITCEDGLKNEVKGAYVSDLLSDVMGHAKDGDIWITLQSHMNIIAVAGLKELAGIIIVGDRPVQADVMQRAESENITILMTPFTAFEAAGKLYQLLK